MTWLALKIASWVLHALLVMLSVAVVSRHNPRNTLGRALLVTLLVALLVTPFAYFWFLLIPGLVALIAWLAVYTLAYNIGVAQALLAGFVQVLLAIVVDAALPNHPPPRRDWSTWSMNRASTLFSPTPGPNRTSSLRAGPTPSTASTVPIPKVGCFTRAPGPRPSTPGAAIRGAGLEAGS